MLLVLAYREQLGREPNREYQYHDAQNANDPQIDWFDRDDRAEQKIVERGRAAAGEIDQQDTASNATVKQHGQGDIAARPTICAQQFDDDCTDSGDGDSREQGRDIGE